MARVRLFANLRELAGTSQLEVDGETIDAVVGELADRFGDDFRVGLKTARLWKNGDEASGSESLLASDELAVIPPVSGGASALPANEGYENIFLVGAAVALWAANALGNVAVFSAVLVGVVAIWAVDVATFASNRDLIIDYAPVLASIFLAVLTTFGFQASGLGVGAMLSVVVVLAWAVLRPDARDLTSIAATMMASLMASLCVGSILLARVSTTGEEKVAGFIIMALAGALVGHTVGRMKRQLVDQFMASAVATVLAAVAIAYISEFDLLEWFFIGLVVAISFISGRGIGAAFRTGQVYLAGSIDGSLAALDGPVLAAAVFLPFVRLIA